MGQYGLYLPMEWKHTDSSVKKKVSGVVISKQKVFWNMKEALRKDDTANSAYYFQSP